MESDILFKQIIEILVNEFEVEKSKIKLDSSFYYDLGLDSLDLVDFSLFLETVTHKIIPVKELKDISKVKDIILVLDKYD